MNPLLQYPGEKPGKFRVGQKVRLKHGFPGLIAEIIEDRGPIGFRGRRLYGILLHPDPWNEFTTESAEEELEAVPDGPEATPADGK
jgi:hypothetical protein